MSRAWDEKKVEVNELRLDTWKAALIEAKGVISHAARAVGINRSYATKLNRKYALTEFAAELRSAAGARTLRSGARAGTVGLGRPSK